MVFQKFVESPVALREMVASAYCNVKSCSRVGESENVLRCNNRVATDGTSRYNHSLDRPRYRGGRGGQT